MNSFLVKIGVLAVIVIALIVAVKVFTPSKDDTVRTETTISQVEENTVEVEPAKPQKTPQVEKKVEVIVEEPEVEVVEHKFRQLSEVDSIQAQQLLTKAKMLKDVARKMPVRSFTGAVETCREIIKKYPGTEFDYKARQVLADVPKRFWRRFDITLEEATPENCFKSQQ